MNLEMEQSPRASASRGLGRFGRIDALIAGVVALGLLVGWAPATQAAGSGEEVNVLYAGSLVNLMERSAAPQFDRVSGDRFRGFAGGSNELANEIKGKLRRADVFIGSNPKADARLMGAANSAWVTWYISFARSPLVLGYASSSRFAADFKRLPWYRVLLEPGIRIGRTDPTLDPKGALTVELMKRAAAFYHIPHLARRVLGAPDNPAQVLPEDALLGRIQSGLIDAGFFYSTETADAGLPEVRLPASIAPHAVYTITIIRDAPHPAAAARFVAFLLGPQGRALLEKHGLELQAPALAGSARDLPRDLQSILHRPN